MASMGGTASLILKPNRLPFNGQCSVNSTQGISLLTYFTISCSEWIDVDGNIVKYEFMGNFKIHFKIKTIHN